MDPRPTSITADRQSSQLTILWDDSHTSVYPFELLRLGCPCAECRGGHENMGMDPDPAIFDRHLPDSPQIRLKNIVAVGSYALSPIWEDNHDYGIFNWYYLRALCPCPVCKPI